MRIAYLDCFSGISGDMFLGALLDAGVPAHLFEETVAALNIGAHMAVTRVDRSGISATKVDVSENHAEHTHHHGRHLKQIKQIIAQAGISDASKRIAISIFEALGAAEAKIHNTDIEKIHFHEVGAVDAIVDIVCAAVGAEALHVDEWVCSPLNVGGGTVKCSHGVFPVPAPATVELLKGAPVYSSGVDVELVTPTGAAIVKTLATRFSPFPQMKVEKTGYGAGTREIPGHANVLRLTIGESQPDLATKAPQETITVLEANLDDLNPQVFGYVMDRLLAEGALDAFGVPVQMKKSRPGTMLTVLCHPEDAAKLTQIIFAETTTLGVRRREEQRQCLQRKWVTVPTRWGDIRLKIASMNGKITNYAPEYEDCRRIAADNHVPLKAVMQEAVQQYLGSQRSDLKTSGSKSYKGTRRAR
jgi:hypothetical protein